MQAGVGLLVSDVLPIYMIIPRYSHNYAQFCQLLNSICSPTIEYLCSWEKPQVKPMAPESIFIILIFQHLVISVAFYFDFILLCIFIIKIPKIYLSYHTTFIRSHFRKWPWRDWQPLYRVGCEFLVCLYRWVGLLRSLLLGWYHGSQKLREILTLLLLHHPFLFKENQRKLKM